MVKERKPAPRQRQRRNSVMMDPYGCETPHGHSTSMLLCQVRMRKVFDARHMFSAMLFLCRVYRPSNMFWEQLEAIPIVAGVGPHPWTVIGQRNQCMCLEQNGMKITCKRLPIDIDLPPFRLI